MTDHSDLKTILDRVRDEHARQVADDAQAERDGRPYAAAQAAFLDLRRAMPKAGETRAAFARRLAPLVNAAARRLAGLAVPCPLDQVTPATGKDKESKAYAVGVFQLAAAGRHREATRQLVAAAEFGPFFDAMTGWLRHLEREILGYQTLVRVRLDEDTGRWGAAEVPELPSGPRRRPAFDRDHLWLKWRNEGLLPACIYRKWNAECGQHGGARVSDRRVVAQGIRKAKRERDREQ
jgi:hypothetical protein